MTAPSLLLTTNSPTIAQLEQVTGVPNLATHPDLLIISPLEEKSSISIDQVHQLIQTLAFKPATPQLRLIVIAPAHLLTLPAQQALLKTLEEPPERTQIILATSMAGKLLPTILSRCVRYTIPPQSNAEIAHQEDWQRLVSQKLSITECIQLASNFGTSKEEAILAIQELLFFLQIKKFTCVPAAIKTIRTLHILEKNGNVKLALEDLFFTISKLFVV